MPNTWNTPKLCWINLLKNRSLVFTSVMSPQSASPKMSQSCVIKWSWMGTREPTYKTCCQDASEAKRLVARVCSLWWAMFFRARLRRVMACLRLIAGWLQRVAAAGLRRRRRWGSPQPWSPSHTVKRSWETHTRTVTTRLWTAKAHFSRKEKARTSFNGGICFISACQKHFLSFLPLMILHVALPASLSP